MCVCMCVCVCGFYFGFYFAFVEPNIIEDKLNKKEVLVGQ